MVMEMGCSSFLEKERDGEREEEKRGGGGGGGG